MLDGTWSQAKALWWRNAWMLKCQRVILGPAQPSRYGKLRKEPRGDGLSIGPGQPVEWTPLLISDDVAWANNYRGLWGLDTQDRFGGERAPSGPKYNRDGSIRMSWYNPLGWAGVDKLFPPSHLPDELRERMGEVEAELAELRKQMLR